MDNDDFPTFEEFLEMWVEAQEEYDSLPDEVKYPKIEYDDGTVIDLGQFKPKPPKGS